METELASAVYDCVSIEWKGEGDNWVYRNSCVFSA
jgi:hypothetical protein